MISFKRTLCGVLLAFSLVLQSPRMGAQQSGGGGSTGGGGGSAPGGAVNSVQYKVDATTFGGAAWTVGTGSALSANQVPGTWLQNIPTPSIETAGNFTFTIGRASNGPMDLRPDNTMAIGWNANGAATGILPNGTGVGSSQLSFEDYCSFGTGCLAGDGGQSETYFAMDDGRVGGDVRPLGFFQRKFQSADLHYLYTIARADSWTFWDRAFNYNIFSIDDNSGVGGIRTFDSLISSSLTSGTFLTINGSAAVGLSGSGDMEFGRAGGVDLAPGGDGSGKVRALSNHFQTSPSTIEDSSNDQVRIMLGAGDAARHLSIANTSNTVLFTIAGTDTNPDYEFDTKGTGNFIINNAGNGVLRSYPHAVLGYNTGGVTSTTSNSCGTTDPAIAGSDVAGKVTVGATGGTSCTVAFGYNWAFPPACVANGAQYTRVISSTSGFVLTGTFGAGEVISYICIGGQ